MIKMKSRDVSRTTHFSCFPFFCEVKLCGDPKICKAFADLSEKKHLFIVQIIVNNN